MRNGSEIINYNGEHECQNLDGTEPQEGNAGSHEENDEESSQAGYDDESESSQAGYDDESSSDDEKNEPIWFPVLDGDSFSSVTTRTLK
eukprot:CAMPEP_0206207838 /NCGR_PEP_ID=MMETSP0166-20121206/15834_1 /ASSEMBLY_ACC=CAM_ASM_000260 /TAXON_ID=95228 /ORGANISM="Vannella robusta, Strain DIVA3 518/3/11/1/6" /LENGTH=88 /DNA_ID=CAMNT_0053628685 /DNA_START=1 /DNA_END=267 /DNA_ORIENTATION=+